MIINQNQAERLFKDTFTPLGQFHKESQDFLSKNNGNGTYELVDTLAAIAVIDPSAILESFQAYGAIDTTNGMNKGAINLYKSDSLRHLEKSMLQKYDIDCSVPNMTVVTQLDKEKTIDLIANSIGRLGKGVLCQ